MKPRLFLACLGAGFFMSLLTAPPAFSADFGLVLDTAGEYLSDTAGKGPGFTGTLSPWLSALINDKTSLFLSGKLSFGYRHDREEWTNPPLAELERGELNFRPLQRVYLSLGRQGFRDPAGMIASGVFDGLSGSLGVGRARLRGGVFYTGLLYKETAKVLMSPGDREAYVRPFDYGEGGSYGASRRLVGTLGAEFPDLSSRTSLNILFLAQFDLNGYGEGFFHSQYLEGRYGFEAFEGLGFFATGTGSFMEREGEGDDGWLGFAGSFGIDWEVPGRLVDMVQGELCWGSGGVNGTVGSFRGLSGITRGIILTPLLGGMTDIRGQYTARAGGEVSVSLGGGIFVRTDLESFYDRELDRGSEERFLGGEVYGRMIWAPQSALQVEGGWGVFFPGGAFEGGTEARWKVNAGLIVSL